MSQMYFILSVVGWAWLVLVAIFLVIRFTILRKRTRGFDVVALRGENVPVQTDGGGGNNR